MRIRLLGDVAVGDQDHWQRAGPAKQASVLAVLAFSPNKAVSHQTLIHRVWGSQAPSAAKNALYSHIARLRRLIAAVPDARIVRGGRDGYRLEIPAERVDLFAMRSAVSRAGGLAGAEEHTEAAALWAEAIGMWHGRPLNNIDGSWADRMRDSLERERHGVLSRFFDTELALARHTAIIDDLTAVVQANPHVEDFAAQLMQALYCSGRQADALAQFVQTSTRLRDDLGIEPGHALRSIHRRILNQDPRLHPEPQITGSEPASVAGSALPPADMPRQLPAAALGFVGRDRVIAEMNRVKRSGSDAAAVLVVTGMAGVGKTTLAVRWGHQVASDFPDGQLFADLRGFDLVEPRSPDEILVRFLRTLGVLGEKVPDNLDDVIAQYRSLTARKRLLVVLDNAGSADQVIPLLPTGPGCLTVVTSRNSLSGLVATQGANRVGLEVLTTAESVELLRAVLGPDRVAAEPDAVARLTSLCGALPLAMRISAANLTVRPCQAIVEYVDELSQGRQMAGLAIDGDSTVAVRLAFDASYRGLTKQARRIFRLLGVVPGPSFTSDAVAALAGVTPAEAATELRSLSAVHLVLAVGVRRYGLHDLLREYARERMWADGDDLAPALAGRRLYDWYLSGARAVSATLVPEALGLEATLGTGQPPTRFDSRDDAVEWCDAERLNLSAAIQAAAPGAATAPELAAATWLLADALRVYSR